MNYALISPPLSVTPEAALSPHCTPLRFSSGAAMPSFVDAADAAGAAQGSSALVVATGAAVAAGHDDFSVVVAAASSPSLRQSDSGQCRKRLRRTDFPDISDTEYREMMQRRRKEQETTRDRGRVRTGRSYQAREEQQRRSHEYRAASERRMSAWLLKAAPVPPQPLASPPKQSCSWNSVWSEQVPALVMDQPISVNHDDWWQRLEKHGLVAGNMLTNNVETDRLYAAARGRRHSV